MDTHTKIWTEITDIIVLGRKYWSSCRVFISFHETSYPQCVGGGRKSEHHWLRYLPIHLILFKDTDTDTHLKSAFRRKTLLFWDDLLLVKLFLCATEKKNAYILFSVSTQFRRQLFSGFVLKMDETTTPYRCIKVDWIWGFSADDE